MKRDHVIRVLKNMLVIRREDKPWVRYRSGKTYFWCLDPRDYMTDDLVFYQEGHVTVTIPYESIVSICTNPFGDIVIALKDWGSDIVIQHEALEPKPREKVKLPVKPIWEFKKMAVAEGLPNGAITKHFWCGETDGLEMSVQSKSDGKRYRVLMAQYIGSRQAGLLSVKALNQYSEWRTVLRYATAEEVLDFIKKEGGYR